MSNLDTVVRSASVFIGADEIIKITNDIIKYNFWYADPLKSLTQEEFDGVRPLTEREIHDAIITGKMEAEGARGNFHLDKDTAFSLLRHALSLEPGLTVRQVREIIDELIVEVIMEI